MWLFAGLLVLLMGLLGHRLMSPAIPVAMRPTLTDVLPVMANLYCVYVAVGGITMLAFAYFSPPVPPESPTTA